MTYPTQEQEKESRLKLFKEITILRNLLRECKKTEAIKIESIKVLVKEWEDFK